MSVANSSNLRSFAVPSFLGRRYMRSLSAVSRREKVAGAAILLLTAAVVATFGWQVRRRPGGLFAVTLRAYEQDRTVYSGRAGPAPADWLPTEPIAGFAPPARVEYFQPDELYTKIDGRAEFYLQFGVRRLVFASFAHESDPRRAVDVYCYQMDTPQAARAAFEAEKPPEPTPVGIGDVAYEASGAVYFCLGPNYVQVLSPGATQQEAAAVRQIAEVVAKQLGQ